MAGSARRDAARARLRRKAGNAGSEDQALIGGTLRSVSQAVEQRNPPSDDQANREAVDEVQKMRAEKRAKSFVRAARG